MHKDSFHISFTLLYRIWLIVAGGVSIMGIPFWFNGVEQGYFYTFSSLIAAQVLFELGTAFVITQLTAHEMGRAKDCEEFANRRVAEILMFSNTWFFFGEILIAPCQDIRVFPSTWLRATTKSATINNECPEGEPLALGNKFQIPNSKFQIPRSKFQDPNSKIQISKSTIRNPQSAIKVPGAEC